VAPVTGLSLRGGMSWSMPLPGLSGHGLNRFTGRTASPRAPTQNIPCSDVRYPLLSLLRRRIL
jgi:hypothetical protein